MAESKEIQDKIIKISKDIGIPTKKILDLLYILSKGAPIENNYLLQRIGVSKNVLNQTKKLLSSILEPPSKKTQLKKDDILKIKTLFDKNYRTEESLWDFLQDEDFKETSKLIEEYQDYHPSPNREYDQFTATVKTTAMRASLLNFYEDIKGKRLLFLGDDDLTSIAVANFKTAKEISILDIDDRISNIINSISNKNQLGIKVAEFDLRKPLPLSYLNRFDIVFIDPPYTQKGIKLFISRAIDALDRTNHVAKIYVCYGNSERAKERFLPIQEILTNSGLIIKCVFDKFNRYSSAESIGSTSSLFICEVTPKTKPLIRGYYEKEIYTND